MTDYGGMELDRLELAAFNAGRRAGLEEAAKYILTWFTDPNRRSMATGIRALSNKPRDETP